jgi:iron(III) transport system substrate-binding protein
MNRIRNFALGFAGALLLAGTASAAEVNVYNGRHYSTDRQLWEGFTKATGIKVNVIEGGEDQLLQRIKSEGANSPADVFITVDAGRLGLAAREGVFQPTKSAALEAAVPANLREPDGLWFGIATRARVIVFARDRVKPGELSTYENLADPKWKGRILVRTGTHIYNLSLTGSIIAAHGEAKAEEWAKGLVANLARSPKGGDTDQLKAVAAGEGDLAISNTYYVARLLKSEKPEDKAVADKLAVFFPNQNDRGTHVNVSGAGVVKTAPNKANAVKFIEYLVTPEAQRYLADTSMEFPANPKVQPHGILAAWGDFKHDQLNAAKFASYQPEAMRIMDRVGWK